MNENGLNIIRPSDQAYTGVLESIRHGGWSLLCGSAISIFEPTSLPLGMAVASQLASAFCLEAGVDDRFHRLALALPFEVVLSLYPRRDELDIILASYFRDGGQEFGSTPNFQPNQVHRVIASLLSQATFRNIITTNYDTCIETASKDSLETIVDDRELSVKKEGIIFKIHGCAVRGSLVYAIDQEPRLPDRKADFLRHTVGQKLLVIGYSGLDFEICPELYAMSFDQFAWVALPTDSGSPDLSPTARKVLENHTCHAVLCADMRTVLRDLSGHPSDWLPPLGPARTPTLSDVLLNRLSASERRLWAARVFGAMCAPSAVYPILEIEAKASGSMSRPFQEVHKGALTQSGMYKVSADLSAEEAENPKLDAYTRFSARLGEAGAAGMGAFDERADSALWKAESILPGISEEKVRTEAALMVEWLKLLRERGKLNRKDAAEISGLVDKFRKLRAAANSSSNGHGLVGLCENEIKEIAGEEESGHESDRMPEDAHDIFAKQGNFVGQVTAERDRARRTWAQRDAEIIESRVEYLRLLGLRPELWRVLYTLIHFKADRDERLALFREFENELDCCQFSDDYVSSMKRAAREAIDKPKGAPCRT